MMPESFREASDHHRLQESREMIQRAQEMRQQTAETWPVTLTVSNNRKNFLRAVKTAAALDIGISYPIAVVRFRPYPSKSPGFWRIEVTYAKTNLGSYRSPYIGSEWYVHEDQLWAAWEAAAGE